ncbi:MAG: GCN5-related N-acetyltransferase [Pelosinus sp.]|jgi:GNAT superfamily N-acetyltransferase|nr:GCN5-related N-acetyltransferase [Pelosinus sp.]
MSLSVREASPSEGKILTDISFASKQYWNYPNEYFEIWKDELTISPAYIKNNVVYVAEVKGFVIGYISLVELNNDISAGNIIISNGFCLEHIFILPEYIGKGIGSRLIASLKEKCREMYIDKIYILSDPNAKGFYDKIGACYLEESPSNIEGRTVSFYELHIRGV